MGMFSSPPASAASLWRLAFTHKPLILASCVFSVLGTAASFVPFLAVYGIIAEVLRGMADSISPDYTAIVSYGWYACFSAMGAIVLTSVALLFSHLAAFKTLYEVKLAFISHLAALPLGFHTDNPSGKLRKIVDEHIEKLEGFIAHQLPDIFGSFSAPLVILGLLLYFDWRLGVASFVPVVLAYYVMATGYQGKDAKKFIEAYNQKMAALSDASVEYVRGMTVIKAFNQTVFSFRKFHATIKEFTEYCLYYTKCFQTPMGLFLGLINNVYLFVVPVGIMLYSGDADYAAYVKAFLFYLIFSISLAGPFMKLLYVSHRLNQIQAGLRRVGEVFQAQPLPETENPQCPVANDIVFDAVSFQYPSHDDDEALCEASFIAGEGAITALVGASGSGKSTAAILVPRFYDVTGGAIRIGGVDVRNIATSELLSRVSFVFQDVFLFKQSVKENIRTGKPEATDAEIEMAARAAQCHEFIMALPQGYDTVIGKKGAHLSGGERQRLSIARAIIKNAPVLLLDEATAFADPDNEYQINKALRELVRDKTVIVIAHRLSTIRNADRIIVLDRGRVAEAGTHDELLQARGLYSGMWERYQRTLDWKLAGAAEEEAHAQ
jgi:ATP-binding cassette subfamily B protein